jgi:hypothetical protein
MSWVAAGVGGATVIGGLVSGFGANKAAKQAANTNREIAAQNMRAQQEAQKQAQENFDKQQNLAFGGQQGFVIDKTGQALTNLLFDPAAELAAAQGFIPQAQRDLTAGANTLSDIFSGRAQSQELANLRGITDQRITAFNPLAESRLNAVDAQRQAIEQAGQDAIASLDARRTAQGFMGTSTFDQNAIARNFLNARQAQAVAQSQAEIQNAQGVNKIQEERLAGELALPSQFRNLQLNTLDQPLQQQARRTSGLVQPQVSLAAAQGKITNNLLNPLPVMSPQGVDAIRNDFKADAMPTGLGLAGSAISGAGTVGMGVVDSINERKRQERQDELFEKLLT